MVTLAILYSSEKINNNIMEHLTLSIKFTAKPDNSAAFKEVLRELFKTISSEPNFINATIHEGNGKPEEFLVYETWNDNFEHFLKVQMKRPYAVAFEQKLVDMGIQREPSAYTPFAYFGPHLIEETSEGDV
jgi:quinol monooxygenase YgiN